MNAAPVRTARPLRGRNQRPAPARRDTDAPRRPTLRVVPPNALSPQGRRRRARRTVGFGALLVTASLFGVVAFHVVLAQTQFKLEAVEAEAMEAQARYERLRLEVAELEAPGRVVAVAQDRLGMVPPATVVYLASIRPRPAEVAPATSAESSWPDVKPHLAARR